MRMVSEAFKQLLDARSVRVLEHLDTAARKTLRRAWQEAYALGLQAPKGHDWHTFSYNHAVFRTGRGAMLLYQDQALSDFIVFPPPRVDSTAYWCKAETMPDFSTLQDDVYVMCPQMNWTMVFTHEESWGFGPYFSRSDGQKWAVNRGE